MANKKYSSNFEDAVAHVFKEEAGYVKNKFDRGGTTNFGITKKTYADYIGKPVDQISDEEIRKMPKDFAKQIYHDKYWNVMKGDSIQSGKASKLLFSQMVNRGPGVFKAVKKELGLDANSSTVDAAMLEKLNASTNGPEKEKAFLVNRVENNRRFHERIIEKDPTQKVFARGWQRRNDNDGLAVGIEPVPRYISSATIPGIFEDDIGENYAAQKANDPDEIIEIVNQEYQIQSGDFLFNDQKLDIPPEQISIMIDEYENSHLLIRTENPVITQSGRKRIRIIVNFSVDVGYGWSKLAKIITQIRKTPIATVENEKIRKELFGDDEQFKYDTIGVVVDNINGYIEEDFPTLIRCTLQMSWFNHAPYVENLRYKENSDKEGRVIYQNKPSSLYKKFYKSGTSNNEDKNLTNFKTYNDPSLLTNKESIVIMFKEYAKFSNTFVIVQNEGGSKLDKNKTMIDGDSLAKRIELEEKGWYFAEEDEEKLGQPIEGVWYRWRKIEIPFSDFSNSSGALIAQNASFSLSTNPTYIPMEKYSIPTIQFLGGSASEIRAILFAAAEHVSEKDKTPVETSSSLANLQTILRNVSEDRVRFSKFNKENHLLIMHPLAKLMTYGLNSYSSEKMNYVETMGGEEYLRTFDPNDFLPVVLSSLESATIPGLPFASKVQLDFKETRFGKKQKSIKYSGSVASAKPSDGYRAQENIIKKLYNKSGIKINLQKKIKEVHYGNINVIEGVFEPRTEEVASLVFPYQFSNSDTDRASLLAEALTFARHVDSGIVDIDTAFSSEYFKSEEMPLSPNIKKATQYKGKFAEQASQKIWEKSFNAGWVDQFVTSFYIDFSNALQNGEEWVKDYIDDFEQYISVKPKGYDDIYSDMKIPEDEVNPAFYFSDNLKRVDNFKNNILKNMPNNYLPVAQNVEEKIFGNFLDTFNQDLKKTSSNSYGLAFNYAAKNKSNGSGTAKVHPVNLDDFRVFSTQQAIANASPPTSGLFAAYPGFRVQLFSNRYSYGQKESGSDLSLEEIKEERQMDLLDIFDLSSIIDIKIIKDQYEAADVMIIRVLGTDKSLLTKQNKDPSYDPASFSLLKIYNDIVNGKTSGMDSNNSNLSDVGLQEGTRIRCLMGNSAIVDELSIEFNGRIAAINGKDIVEIYCVGDGHELIQNTIGFPGESKDREYTSNSETVELIKEIISGADEIKSFGNTKFQVFTNVKFNLPDFLGGKSAFDNIFAPSLHPDKDATKFVAGASDRVLSILSTAAGASLSIWGPAAVFGALASVKVLLFVGAAAVAAGVLGEAYDSITKKISPCKFVVYKQTIWDVLQELTLRHPGYIVAVVPFDRRSTLYFGEPDGIYFYRGVESAMEKSILASSMIRSGGILKASTIRQVYENLLSEKTENPNLGNEVQSDAPYSVPVNKEDQSFKQKLDAKKIKSQSLAIMNMQKTFRNYHFVTSENDIISNDIEASSLDVANSVQVYYPKDDNEGNPDGTTWFSNYALTDYMKADDNLHSNLINNKVFTFHNAHNEYPEIELPQRYAKAILCKELENIYKGKITILGRKNIKPHDIIILSDTHNRISGPVKVGRVVQSISPQSGWITTIYPKFISIPDTIAGGIQMKAVLKAARYWLGTHTDLFYSNMEKFTPDEFADKDKQSRELEKLIDTGVRGGDQVSEEELTQDFDKVDLEKIGPDSHFSLDQTDLAEDAAMLGGQYLGSEVAGVGRNLINKKGYSVAARSELIGEYGSVEIDKYKKNKASLNRGIYARKSYQEIKSMFNTKNIKLALKNAAQKKDISSGMKVGWTAGKGLFRSAKTGGRLLFRTGVGFAGGFILEHYLSSAIDGLISYAKYRQPIYIFPLTKEGRPWMAALNGYKENTIIESLKLDAQIAADKMGMTAYLIEKFYKEWTEGLPPDRGGVGVDVSKNNFSAYDGDTITMVEGTRVEKIRLKDVNTAEKFNNRRAEEDPNYVAPGEIELEMANLAADFVRNQLEKAKKEGSKIELSRHGTDQTTSQRTVGTIKINGVSLRDMLMKEGLSTPTVPKFEQKLPQSERNNKERIKQIREEEWAKIREIYRSRQRRNR